MRKGDHQSHQKGGRPAVAGSTLKDHNDYMRSWNVEVKREVALMSQSHKWVGTLFDQSPGE